MYPIPSIPLGVVYFKSLQVIKPGQLSSSDHFLLASSTPATWNFIPTGANDFVNQWHQPVFQNIQTLATNRVTVHFFFNLGFKTISITFGTSYALPPNGAWCASQVRPCFRKHTSIVGRSFKGRFFGPPVPLSFIDGNDFTPAAYATYNAMIAAYMTPWTSQGVTFTPLHYSKLLNTGALITRPELLKYPRICRKSRTLDLGYTRPTMSWPV